MRLHNIASAANDEKHRRTQGERTITSEKIGAYFCRHTFIVPEEHERQMSRELHFVHLRNRPEKLRAAWLIPRADRLTDDGKPVAERKCRRSHGHYESTSAVEGCYFIWIGIVAWDIIGLAR